MSQSADRKLFTLIAILITLAIILVYSMSEFVVLLDKTTDLYFFFRELGFGAVAIFIMWFLAQLNPDRWIKYLGFALFFGSAAVMIAMPFLPESLVHAVGGAKRWIRIAGFSIAPVEFFKVGFVWFLAWSFSRKIEHKPGSRLKDEAMAFLPYGVMFLIVMFMIAFIQNDLGQVMVLGMTMIVMLTFAGSSMRFFFTMFLGIITAGVLFIISKTHRIERVKSWWAIAQDSVLSIFPADIAQKLRVPIDVVPYQIGHSLNAIHHGGLFGVGLADGGFKLGFLSDVHTDFILAGTAEEFGFFGIVTIVFLFMLIILRIFKIANRSEDKTFSLFTLGIGLILSFSFLLNSYGISGITPIKGIAVPFLSYGGSSMLASAIGIGMVLMISKKVKL
ncbi:Cell division protein FtsW [hydrothermal vent metagenome]|uniref:peptidoglycan glycosyltransferase n=1 Tax=hydrothermal vent metagenome TaxID=652676 RepID=A0A1W1C526_9ZZZZ